VRCYCRRVNLNRTEKARAAVRGARAAPGGCEPAGHRSAGAGRPCRVSLTARLTVCHSDTGFYSRGGSCYTAAVDVFIFRSESFDHQFAFTLDHEGANLPEEFGPWRLPGEGIPTVVVNVQPIGRWRVILLGIKYDGLYVLRADDGEIVALAADFV
jgi:hypothetical protein